MTSASQPTRTTPDKQKILNRLRRLEGQVRGLQKMVDDERPCQDILTLVSSIKSALEATGDLIFEEYLSSCLAADDQPISPQDIVKTARLMR